MHAWSALGIILGLLVLAVAVFATAQEPVMFLNMPGLALVLGGTIAATLTSFSWRNLLAAIRALFVPTGSDDDPDHRWLQDIMRVAKTLQEDGAPAAEKAVKRVKSPFLQTGLQLVVDCVPSAQMVEVLDWRIERLRAHSNAHADVFDAMAAYAPAFGMVGTLLGLVNMLHNIEGGMAQIGVHLSIALVTTFYGIVLANAVFRPLALTLRRRTQDRMAVLSAAQEALVIMADNHSPAQLKYSLSSYIDPDDPDLVPAVADRKIGGVAHG